MKSGFLLDSFIIDGLRWSSVPFFFFFLDLRWTRRGPQKMPD